MNVVEAGIVGSPVEELVFGVELEVVLEEELQVCPVLVDGAVSLVSPCPFAVFHGCVGLHGLVALEHVHPDEIEVVADDHSVVDAEAYFVSQAESRCVVVCALGEIVGCVSSECDGVEHEVVAE